MKIPIVTGLILPYGVHECLRSHRGVDLTGKPRDSAFACYQYKAGAEDCQGKAYSAKSGDAVRGAPAEL